MKISIIEEHTTNGLIETYELVVNKVKAFFGERLVHTHKNVKNGRYGIESGRNIFHFSDVLGVNGSIISGAFTLNIIANYKTTTTDGYQYTSSSYIDNAFDYIRFGILRNVDLSNPSTRSNSTSLQGLRLYGAINKVFFINVGGTGDTLMIYTKSGGVYSCVTIRIDDSVIKVNNLGDMDYDYRSIRFNYMNAENKVLNHIKNSDNRILYKSEDVNGDSKWRYVESTNRNLHITASDFVNRENKVYGIMLYQPKHNFVTANNSLFPRKDGNTGGAYILEDDESLNYGQVKADGLIPEEIYTIGAFRYKFFPIDVHNQVDRSEYNLGVVVRVE